MKKALFSLLAGLFLITNIHAQTSATNNPTDFIEVENSYHFSDLTKAAGLVLVDFYATWCGPCKMMPPILKQLKKESETAISIIKVDVDKVRSVAIKYKISSIPTLLLFKDGKLIWSQVGVIQLEDLKKVIDEAQQ